MHRRSLAAGLVVVLAVVATVAVALPPTVPESVGDDGTSDRVEVVGGELDADAQALFDWTEDALERDVPQAPRVQLTSVDESQLGPAVGNRFQRLLVLDHPDDQLDGGVYAFVSGFSTDVTINADRFPAVRDGETDRTVEGLLVHEYVHVIQFQTDAYVANVQTVPGGTDEDHAWNAVTEGGAEFVANHYTDQDRIATVGETWNDPETPATYRLSYWDYYRGMVYLEDRLEEPADLWTAYEEPPRSTAAMLRGEVRGEPVPNRTVDLELADHAERDHDRLGAWFVEVALSRNVDPERARDVAAGWRWGRLTTVEPTNETGRQRHVWITEWRDEAAADDFEDAMSEYLGERWERSDATWSGVDGTAFALERPDDHSVALVAGPEGFPTSVEVATEGQDYVVESASNGSTTPTEAVAGGPTAAAGA